MQEYAYQFPFVQPLPVWDVWPLLLIPLLLAVGWVWKCLKCKHVRQIPGQTLAITGWILGGFVAAAAVLYGVAEVWAR